MANSRPRVTIYTDGGCKPNPGPGGWAALLIYNEHQKALSGAEHGTTNNRMELTAACAALEALNRPCEVAFFTDSEYLKRGITEWLPKWTRNGWRTATKRPVLNQDLWQRLHAAAQPHEITWHWVKGHSSDAYNQQVDRLAAEAREKLTQT